MNQPADEAALTQALSFMGVKLHNAHRKVKRMRNSKFSDLTTHILYHKSLDGFSEETGSVDELGWYGRTDSALTDEEFENAVMELDLTDDYDDYEMEQAKEALTGMAGAILQEDNFGNVYGETYAQKWDLDYAWTKIEQEYDEYWGDGEEEENEE